MYTKTNKKTAIKEAMITKPMDSIFSSSHQSTLAPAHYLAKCSLQCGVPRRTKVSFQTIKQRILFYTNITTLDNPRALINNPYL